MLYLLAGGVVIFGIFVYVMFMVFLPEWVGITGKTALNNQKSHQGENVAPDAVEKFLGEDQRNKPK